MGVPVSLLLIAVGAILAFAVNQDPDPAVDIDVVGWILMIVGLAGLLLSILWWERLGPGAWGWHRGGYPPDGPPRRGYGRRRTVVEEDGPPPPPGPPPGPPPP
jgi:Domain of unknown function (DUF6458)